MSSDVDRLQGEMSFEIGDNLLQFMGMYTKDEFKCWDDNDSNNSLPVFNAMNSMLGPNSMRMAANGDIEEMYAEVRWTSPEDQRLRYALSGTYYDYTNNLQTYNGFGALEFGLTLPNGTPVNPRTGITISDIATNMGVGFNATYDLTDRTTLSLEARYQIDEVCGQDALGANVKSCSETKSFAPCIAFTTAFNDNTSVHGQFSIGSNPAGVNIAF